MVLEQLGPHRQPLLRQRFAGAGTTCRIGRDLGCDIVVDDEHAALEHALLTLLEDGRVSVRDLGTQNGTRVDGKRIPAGVEAIVEQCELIVGRTRLRLRTRHAPMGPERVFRRDFMLRHRTPLAAAGVAACIAYAGFQRWLDAPASLLLGITLAALIAVAVIAIWSGLWALTTKLNHGGWQVRVHVAIAAIAAAFGAWVHWLAGLVAFAAQWSLLVQAGFAVMAATAFFALYLHLREATYYGRRIAAALAGAVTAVIGAVLLVVATGFGEGDVNRLKLGPDVRLAAEPVVPYRDIADYLAEVDELKRAAGRERQKSLLNAPLADAED